MFLFNTSHWTFSPLNHYHRQQSRRTRASGASAAPHAVSPSLPSAQRPKGRPSIQKAGCLESGSGLRTDYTQAEVEELLRDLGDLLGEEVSAGALNNQWGDVVRLYIFNCSTLLLGPSRRGSSACTNCCARRCCGGILKNDCWRIFTETASGKCGLVWKSWFRFHCVSITYIQSELPLPNLYCCLSGASLLHQA